MSTTCSQCHAPLPAGATFCGNCGNHLGPGSLSVPASQEAATVRASAQPADAYAAQYASQPGTPPPYQPYSSGPPASFVPPPNYVPGPPPVMAPGGVAPWAQPLPGKKKRSILGLLVALVVIVAILGGGGYLLFTKVLHKSAATTTSTGTPGAGTTPGAGSTPGSSSGQQTLPAINRQVIYSGVTVTILSALEAKSVAEFQLNNPDQNEVLKIQAKLNNQSPKDVYVSNQVAVVDAAGNSTAVSQNVAGALPTPTTAQTTATGFLYFEVPKGHKVAEWTMVLGAGTEAQETVPLTGAYDPSIWQETPKPIGKSVSYDNGSVVATVVKVTAGVWTPTGYQAPQGMRFILVDLAVANKEAVDITVGDPEFVVQFPGGQRLGQDSNYGYFINDVLGAGQSKDEGYACFVAPTAIGDFMMLFYNADGSLAGQVDLGTL